MTIQLNSITSTPHPNGVISEIPARPADDARKGRGCPCSGAGECRYQVEPATASLRDTEGGTSADPAEVAERYGPETTVPDRQERLVCSRCGSHGTDMVVTGTERR